MLPILIVADVIRWPLGDIEVIFESVIFKLIFQIDIS